jgi:hypothetical protein
MAHLGEGQQQIDNSAKHSVEPSLNHADSEVDNHSIEPHHRNIIGISSAHRKDHRVLGGLAFIPVLIVRRKWIPRLVRDLRGAAAIKP